jgi:transposase
MAKIAGPVTGGVDTHAGVHVAAVIDQVGRVLGTESFPADEPGYARLLGWLAGHGPLARAGVEGTGSYGAGLACYLAAQRVTVLEVPRPDRARRRRHGKSDPVDAVSAALAALAGEDCGTPKARTGAAELICPELSGQRIWVNSRCELPFYVFLVRLSRAPVLKPGVPTL